MKIRKILPMFMTVVLLLSSCKPIVSPPDSQSVPETASAETGQVPETAEVPETSEVPETIETLSESAQADCLVQFISAYGEAPEPQSVKKGELLTEPEEMPIPGKTFEGWYRDGIGGKWDFDEDKVKGSMTLTAVFTDPLPRVATRLNKNDVGECSSVLDGVNAAVVIFVGFTDGYKPDRERFENYFKAEYGQEDALRSVSAYFKYNSYGKVSFDYYFYYYDTGMSCKEAYDYTLDENVGHKLLYDGFREFQQNYQGDLKDWDRNQDGYTDLLYFVTGEKSSKTSDNGNRVIYGNATPTESFKPDPEKPEIHQFSKLTYESWLTPMTPAMQKGGIRILLHETGHLFGLHDYYDSRPYEDEDTFDTLGLFDMQSSNFGDWNVYSRFACGWLDPYVVDGTQDEVTIKLGCSSEVPDAVLIPTEAGWNGTAFDEYILIDVLAPYSADGYDWPMLTDDVQMKKNDPRKKGGIRVYHVDSRMARVDQSDMASNRPATAYEELLETIQDPRFKHNIWLWNRFYASNGIDPLLPEDSRFCHLIEIVPSDGSSRFRRNGHKMYWQALDSLTVMDLYGPGDVFSMETCADAFVNAPLMNNGSAFDYEVRVDFYDPDAREAIVTIRKIR